jgi:hypothetical protein
LASVVAGNVLSVVEYTINNRKIQEAGGAFSDYAPPVVRLVSPDRRMVPSSTVTAFLDLRFGLERVHAIVTE